jgi:hypothetical protein
MKDQGLRPITQSGSQLSFDNGFTDPAMAQAYAVTIDANNAITGKAISRNGQFSLKGTCR